MSGSFFAAQRAQHDFGFAFEDFFCGFGQLQCLILGDVDGEVAEADALADDAAPFFVGLPAADAESGEFVVTVAPYPVVAFTAQQVDDIAGGKALSGAIHATEELLYEDGTVEAYGRMQAVVAMAARGGFFAEMFEQEDAAAGGGFADGKHGIELLHFDLFLHFVAVAFGDTFAQQYPVVQTVTQPTHGRQPVPPGAAGFLVEMFDALGHIEMGDEAHVRFVYAHTEGNGGDDDNVVFAGKTALVCFAHFHAQAGMVGNRVQSVFAEELGDVFDFFAAEAIDDAALPFYFFADEVEKLLFAVVFFDNLIIDIRAVKAGDEFGRVFEMEEMFDVGAGRRIGGRGQGNARHLRIAFGKQP